MAYPHLACCCVIGLSARIDRAAAFGHVVADTTMIAAAMVTGQRVAGEELSTAQALATHAKQEAVVK